MAIAVEPSAVLISAQGANGPLRALIERLAGVGIPVVTVAGLTEAQQQLGNDIPPPCVIVDLRDHGSDPEDIKLAVTAVQRIVQALPQITPIAITEKAELNLVLACVRTGCADVLDLTLEGTSAARAIVQRVFRKQAERATEARTHANLRQIVEDFFRDLIRTERRSIDLEEKLAAHQRVTGELPSMLAIEQQRPPAVLVIEPDRAIADRLAERLEAQGVSTFAYLNGEHTLREVELLLAGGTPFDLVLIAVQLPGIDGLETVRRLRERVSGLPAFLMTSSHDADIAEHAADLGVVGFVHKPLDQLDEMIERLCELARESLVRTREQAYLQRIKERHERVLARYRALPPTT
jgi:CheY-like chemotaxis protein